MVFSERFPDHSNCSYNSTPNHKRRTPVLVQHILCILVPDFTFHLFFHLLALPPPFFLTNNTKFLTDPQTYHASSTIYTGSSLLQPLGGCPLPRWTSGTLSFFTASSKPSFPGKPFLTPLQKEELLPLSFPSTYPYLHWSDRLTVLITLFISPSTLDSEQGSCLIFVSLAWYI